MKLAIFCDFDETITRTNVTDSVLDRFADHRWMEIQEEWLAGRLSAREVLEQQMPLVTVTSEELEAFVDSVQVDSAFAPFALSCMKGRDSLYILSDGFDYWIHRILQRALSATNGWAMRIPVFACHLKVEGSRLPISFPYFPEGCCHGCATCKLGLFHRLTMSGEKTVVIGDGVSDLLLAREADLVLAKDSLREFCQKEGIPNHPFRDFRDIMAIISAFRKNGLGDTT